MTLSEDRPRVVSIIGTSFSGSTLANLMLGSHPKIYAGGELSALVFQRGSEAAMCSSCGADCVHWTASMRQEASEDNMYRLARSIFKQDVLVNSSKSVGWTSGVLSRPENAEFDPVYVLMIKHPIRYLASCVVNIPNPEPRGLYRNIRSRFSKSGQKRDMLDQWLDDLEQFYDNFFCSLPREVMGAPVHLLHYERLIDDPRRALAPILTSLKLHFVPAMEKYYDAAFHQIGGNAGATFQIKRRWSADDQWMPAFRRQFYETNLAPKIDNKFENVFSPGEIAGLKSNPIARRLIDKLGYSASSMPFAI